MNILIPGAIAAVWALLILVLRETLRKQRETPTVALVRKRRELTARLHELAGSEDAELLRSEARRLRAGTGSIEVLEAAIERAQRLPARAMERRPAA